LSDFLRTLLVLATTATWLKLDESNVWSLKRREELNRIREAIGRTLPSARQKRPYASRGIGSQDSETTSLVLPAGVARLIELNAKAHGFSKNDLCGILLTRGFVMYLAGEASLLQTTLPVGKPSERPTPDTNV
jgi:hypothetical protein